MSSVGQKVVGLALLAVGAYYVKCEIACITEKGDAMSGDRPQQHSAPPPDVATAKPPASRETK